MIGPTETIDVGRRFANGGFHSSFWLKRSLCSATSYQTFTSFGEEALFSALRQVRCQHCLEIGMNPPCCSSLLIERPRKHRTT